MSAESLNGAICTRVYAHYPRNFTFQFGAATLAVDCLWRVIADGKVALTSRDHGQQFGLALRTLCWSLTVVNGWRFSPDSSGYEPWNLHAPGVYLVALGGGGVANFSPEA